MVGTHQSPAGPAAAGAPADAGTGMVPLHETPVPLLTWPCFDAALVRVALTTRHGGVSEGPYATLNLGLHVGDDDAAVLENRTRVATAMRSSLDDLVFCQQVHQRAVTIVGDEHRGRGARSDADAVPATDALVTTTAGVVLVVLVADCVPIVLHDPVAGVLACVHAGWGGTVRGVTPAAVRAMVDVGSSPANIVAGIGPAIAGEVYQVGDDVADAAGAAFGERTGRVLRPDGTGRFLFDLVAAARIQLVVAGVAEDNVHPSGLSTGPGTPFYSHRLEAPCGRFGVLARLLPGART
jgi:YfiH family protein